MGNQQQAVVDPDSVSPSSVPRGQVNPPPTFVGPVRGSLPSATQNGSASPSYQVPDPTMNAQPVMPAQPAQLDAAPTYQPPVSSVTPVGFVPEASDNIGVREQYAPQIQQDLEQGRFAAQSQYRNAALGIREENAAREQEAQNLRQKQEMDKADQLKAESQKLQDLKDRGVKTYKAPDGTEQPVTDNGKLVFNKAASDPIYPDANGRLENPYDPTQPFQVDPSKAYVAKRSENGGMTVEDADKNTKWEVSPGEAKPILDANGNAVIDDQGNVKTQPGETLLVRPNKYSPFDYRTLQNAANDPDPQLQKLAGQTMLDGERSDTKAQFQDLRGKISDSESALRNKGVLDTSTTGAKIPAQLQEALAGYSDTLKAGPPKPTPGIFWATQPSQEQLDTYNEARQKAPLIQTHLDMLQQRQQVGQKLAELGGMKWQDYLKKKSVDNSDSTNLTGSAPAQTTAQNQPNTGQNDPNSAAVASGLANSPSTPHPDDPNSIAGLVSGQYDKQQPPVSAWQSLKNNTVGALASSYKQGQSDLAFETDNDVPTRAALLEKQFQAGGNQDAGVNTYLSQPFKFIGGLASDWKHTAAGAVAGGVSGLLGGPFAEVTSPGGALVGGRVALGVDEGLKAKAETTTETYNRLRQQGVAPEDAFKRAEMTGNLSGAGAFAVNAFLPGGTGVGKGLVYAGTKALAGAGSFAAANAVTTGLTTAAQSQAGVDFKPGEQTKAILDSAVQGAEMGGVMEGAHALVGAYGNHKITQDVNANGANSKYVQRTAAQFAALDASKLTPDKIAQAKQAILQPLSPTTRVAVEDHINTMLDASKQISDSQEAATAHLPPADPKLSNMTDDQLAARAGANSHPSDPLQTTPAQVQAEIQRRAAVRDALAKNAPVVDAIVSQANRRSEMTRVAAQTPDGRALLDGVNRANAERPAGAPKIDLDTAQLASDISPKTEPDSNIQPHTLGYLPLAHDVEQIPDKGDRDFATNALKVLNGREHDAAGLETFDQADQDKLQADAQKAHDKAVKEGQPNVADVPPPRPVDDFDARKTEDGHTVLTEKGLAKLRQLVPSSRDMLQKDGMPVTSQHLAEQKGKLDEKSQPKADKKLAKKASGSGTTGAPVSRVPHLAGVEDSLLSTRLQNLQKGRERLQGAIDAQTKATGSAPAALLGHATGYDRNIAEHEQEIEARKQQRQPPASEVSPSDRYWTADVNGREVKVPAENHSDRASAAQALRSKLKPGELLHDNDVYPPEPHEQTPSASEPATPAVSENKPAGEKSVGPRDAAKQEPVPPGSATPEHIAYDEHGVKIATVQDIHREATKLTASLDNLNLGRGLSGDRAIKIDIVDDPKVTLRAIMGHDGKLSVEVNPERAREEADTYRRARDGGDPRRWIKDAMDEELKHVADMLAAREKWEAQGSKGSANEFWQKERRENLQDIKKAVIGGDKSVARAFVQSFHNYANVGKAISDEDFAKKTGDVSDENVIATATKLIEHLENAKGSLDVQSVSEFIRQMLQAKNDGTLTESGYRAVVGKLLEWMKSVYANLQEAAHGSPELAHILKPIEDLLKVAENPEEKPFKPMTDAEIKEQENAEKEAKSALPKNLMAHAKEIAREFGIKPGDYDAQELKEGLNKGHLLGLLRKNGMSMDQFRMALNERGFNFETPNDAVQALIHKPESLPDTQPGGLGAGENSGQNEPTVEDFQRDAKGNSSQRQKVKDAATRGDPGAVAGLIRADAGSGGQISRSSQVRASEKGSLVRFARSIGAVFPAERFSTPFSRGQEHAVFQNGKRVVKATRYPDNFGLGMNGGGKASPSDYLERLALSNRIFGDDVKWEGVTIQDGKVHIVTSQSHLVGDPPSSEEIKSYMEGKGFEWREPEGGSAGFWYRKNDNVVVYDANPKNIARSPDGNLHPFDIGIEHPTDAVKKELGLTSSGETYLGAGSNLPRNAGYEAALSYLDKQDQIPQSFREGMKYATDLGNLFRTAVKAGRDAVDRLIDSLDAKKPQPGYPVEVGKGRTELDERGKYLPDNAHPNLEGMSAALKYQEALEKAHSVMEKAVDLGRKLYQNIKSKGQWMAAMSDRLGKMLADIDLPGEQPANVKGTLFDYVAHGGKDAAVFTDDLLSQHTRTVMPSWRRDANKPPESVIEKQRVNDLISKARNMGQRRFVFNGKDGIAAQVYMEHDGATRVRLPSDAGVGGSFADIKSAVAHLVDKGFNLQSAKIERQIARAEAIARFGAIIQQGLNLGQSRFHFSHADGRTAALHAKKDGSFSVSGVSEKKSFSNLKSAQEFLHDRGFDNLDSSTLEKKLRAKGLHPDQASEPIPYTPKQVETINQYRKAKGLEPIEKPAALEAGSQSLFAGTRDTVDMEQAQSYVKRTGIKDEKASQQIKEALDQTDLPGFSKPYSDHGSRSANVRQPESSSDEVSRAQVLRDPTDPVGLKQAFDSGNTISSLLPKYISGRIPSFDLRGKTINSPSDFAKLAWAARSPHVETLKVAVLNKNGKIVHSEVLNVGSINESLTDVPAIIRAVQSAAGKTTERRVIVAHNHPSGNPTPSSADISVTHAMTKALKTAGIDLVDHIITNGKKFASSRGGWTIDDIPGGGASPWEAVSRDELYPVDNEVNFGRVAGALKQASPGDDHVIYLTTKHAITAIQRVPANGEGLERYQKLVQMIANQAPKEGAFGIMLVSGDRNFPSGARLKGDLEGIAKVVDLSTPDVPSYVAKGLMESTPDLFAPQEEPGPKFPSKEAALKVYNKLTEIKRDKPLTAGQSTMLEAAERHLGQKFIEGGKGEKSATANAKPKVNFGKPDTGIKHELTSEAPDMFGEKKEGRQSLFAGTNALRYSPNYDEGGPRPTTEELERAAREGSPGAGADLLRESLRTVPSQHDDYQEGIRNNSSPDQGRESPESGSSGKSISGNAGRGENDGNEQGGLKTGSNSIDPDDYEKLLSELQQGMPDQAHIDDLRKEALAESMGEKTIGVPRKANPAHDETTRRGIDTIKHIREEALPNEVQSRQKVEDEVYARVEKEGVDPIKKDLLQKALHPEHFGGYTTHDVIAGKILTPQLMSEAYRTGDDALKREAATICYATDVGVGNLARALGANYDPFKSPVQRHLEYLTKVMTTPDHDEREAINQEPTQAKRNARLVMSQNARLKRIEKALAEMGIKPEDIFAGEARVSLKSAKFVQDAIGKGEDARTKQAMRMFADKAPMEAIRQQTGLSKEAVQAARDKFDSEIRANVEAMVRGRGFKAVDFERLDPASLKAGTNAEPRVAGSKMTKAEEDAEIAKVMEMIRGDYKDVDAGKYVKSRKTGPKSKVPEQADYDKRQPFDWKKFDAGNKEQVVRAARLMQAATGNKWEMVHEYWQNSILSGPQTHVAISLGQGMNAFHEFILKRPIEAAINAIIKDPKSASFGEMKHLYAGIMPGVARGWSQAIRTWRTENDFTKTDMLNGQMEIHPTDFQGAGHIGVIPGKLGRVIRIPCRVIMALDSFNKNLAGMMAVGAEAYRSGKAQGFEGDAMTKHIDNEIKTPGSQSWQRAYDIAANQVGFHGELPQYMKDVMKYRDLSGQHSLVEKMARMATAMLFPFVKVPYNLTRIGLRKSPLGILNVGGHIMNGAYSMAQGKPFVEGYSKAQAISDASEQFLAWGATALLASAVEGDSDDDKKMLLITAPRYYGVNKPGDVSALDRQYGGPTMIRLGGRNGIYINYGKFEPMASVLGTIATTVRALKDQPKNFMPDMMGGVVGQLKGNSFVQGMSTILDTIDAAAKGETDGLGARWAEQFLQGFVPNIFRQPIRNLDEAVRDSKFAGPGYVMTQNPAFVNQAVDLYGKSETKTGIAPLRILFQSGVTPSPQLEMGDKFLTNYNRTADKSYWPDRPTTAQYSLTIGGKKVQMTADQATAYDKIAGQLFKQKLNGWMTEDVADHPTEEYRKRFEEDLSEARKSAKERIQSAQIK